AESSHPEPAGSAGGGPAPPPTRDPHFSPPPARPETSERKPARNRGGGGGVGGIDAMVRESTTEYDALDQPVRYVDPLGNRIENRFDAHGNHVRQDFIDRVVDPDSGAEREEVFSSASAYDELDRLGGRPPRRGN